MNTEQSNQMFGVNNISDWLDAICCSHTFALEGKTALAISLLSDVQELSCTDANRDTIRTAINRIKYLLDIGPNEELTRRSVGKLIRYLGSKDFEIVGVWDEEEIYVTNDPATAMGHIFAVDETSLRVRSQIGNHGREHGILLTPGNGEDIISDWNYSTNDVDGFNKVMRAFSSSED